MSSSMDNRHPIRPISSADLRNLSPADLRNYSPPRDYSRRRVESHQKGAWWVDASKSTGGVGDIGTRGVAVPPPCGREKCAQRSHGDALGAALKKGGVTKEGGAMHKSAAMNKGGTISKNKVIKEGGSKKEGGVMNSSGATKGGGAMSFGGVMREGAAMKDGEVMNEGEALEEQEGEDGARLRRIGSLHFISTGTVALQTNTTAAAAAAATAAAAAAATAAAADLPQVQQVKSTRTIGVQTDNGLETVIRRLTQFYIFFLTIMLFSLLTLLVPSAVRFGECVATSRGDQPHYLILLTYILEALGLQDYLPPPTWNNIASRMRYCADQSE